MNVLDYIVLIIAVVFILIGVFKGVIAQVLAILGIVFVAALTATVAPYVQSWFVNTTLSDTARTVVAMLSTVALLAVVYAILAAIVQKLLKKYQIVRVVDCILGGVLGLVSIYLLGAVFFSLFNSTPEEFLPLLKSSGVGEAFHNSWFAQHIYSKNPIGDWIVVDITQKIMDKITPIA